MFEHNMLLLILILLNFYTLKFLEMRKHIIVRMITIYTIKKSIHKIN